VQNIKALCLLIVMHIVFDMLRIRLVRHIYPEREMKRDNPKGPMVLFKLTAV
jgi:hypothetical protein